MQPPFKFYEKEGIAAQSSCAIGVANGRSTKSHGASLRLVLLRKDIFFFMPGQKTL